MKKNSSFVLSLLVISCATLFASCTKDASRNADFQSTDTAIPVGEALQTLSRFLLEVNEEDSNTRSSISKRQIRSIDITYKEDSQPLAYLVNYKDNAGYAVLGADRSLDSIIAVTESGSLDWDSVFLTDSTVKLNKSSFDLLISQFIRNGLKLPAREGGEGGEDEENEDNPPEWGEPNSNGGGGAGYYESIVSPLTLDLSFDQQHSFCHTNNGQYVLCGCPATALAIIAASNQFPIIVADSVQLNYTDCGVSDGVGLRYYFYKSGSYYSSIYFPLSNYYSNYENISLSTMTDSEKMLLISNIAGYGILSGHDYYGVSGEEFFPRTRFMLIASMFNIVTNIVSSWTGTGAFPYAVKDALEDMGYTNVDYWTKDRLDYEQRCRIAAMLNAGKPTIMCGWSLWHPFNNHYWVVDGTYLTSSAERIHCNWGHGGKNNGWFSTSCIRRNH